MDLKPTNMCKRAPCLFWICTFLMTISLSKADFNVTIRFYEFRNPLGLQCAECGSDGGLPACCDDVQRRDNCMNMAPFTCDTRFRFLLRPFGSSVQTAPNSQFPYFTRSNIIGNNSATFNVGRGGLLALPNPFNITNSTVWPGRIQFFIDALDNDVAMTTSGLNEIEVIINRFPIDLELDLGANFTERTTYTGIYNISGLGFDMSFRVQCFENFFGPNCTTFCEPLEGVYTCDSAGQAICLETNRDPSTNCTSCLTGFDSDTNCSLCLSRRLLSSNCTQCLPGFDLSTDCTDCVSGYMPSANGRQCVAVVTEASSQPVDASSTSTSTVRMPVPTGANLRAVSGAIGALAILLIIVLVVLCVIIAVMVLRLARQREGKTFIADEEEPADTATPAERDINNPLYEETTQEEVSPKVDLGQEINTDYETENYQGTHEDMTLTTIAEGEEGGDIIVKTVSVETEAKPGISQSDDITGATQPATEELGPQPNDTTGNVNDQHQPSVPGEYADIVISSTSSGAAADAQAGQTTAATSFGYTEVMQHTGGSEEESMATYTNTTPGVITPEAINHYDFGQ